MEFATRLTLSWNTEKSLRSPSDPWRIENMQNGLAYHFVIGNGTSTGNGQIEVGDRWRRQINGGHDVKTRRNAARSCTLVVFIRWVRNVQRQVEIALRISTIDFVNSFGRFHIAFFLLRA